MTPPMSLEDASIHRLQAAQNVGAIDPMHPLVEDVGTRPEIDRRTDRRDRPHTLGQRLGSPPQA